MTLQYSQKRLNKILETLNKLHGVRLDLDAPVSEIRQAYDEVMEKQRQLVRESSFNSYFSNPEYSKHVLLGEAFRLFLSEIAPKRVRRSPKRAASVKETKQTRTSAVLDKEEKLINEAADREVNRMKRAMVTQPKKIDEKRKRTDDISTLLEAELEQAEVLIAARGIGQDIQDMAEDLASAMVEELMPLVDRMKTEFGPEKANAFNDAVLEKLQSSLDAVKAAKNAIDDGVLTLQGKAPVGGDMSAFPAADEAPAEAPADATAPAEAPPEGEDLAPAEMPPEGEAGGEEAPPADTAFAGADAAAGAPTEPVGRAKKAESRKHTNPMVEAVKRDPTLPPEINSTIDDLEYYLKNRGKSLVEAKEAAIKRYSRLYGDHSLLPSSRIAEAIDAHVLANHKRLTALSRLNKLHMPQALREAVAESGLREQVFREHLREFLARAASHLPQPQYKTKLAEVAAAIERDPKGFVARLLNLVERREMSALTGYDGYNGFRRHLIDKIRDQRLDLNEVAKHLTPAEQDVYAISKLHEAMNEGGLVTWYNSGAAKQARPLLKAIKNVEGETATHVKQIVERALGVIRDYRNEHNDLDDYGRSMLESLNDRYRKISREFEQSLTAHLMKNAAI